MSSPTSPIELIVEMEQPIEQLLQLAYQLAEVVEEENRLLAMGFPSSLTETTDAKLRLSREIEAIMADADAKRRTAAANIGQRGELAKRIRRIEKAVQENSGRLDGAIYATKRRIAAVMSAVRCEVTSESPSYGADGRRPSGSANGGTIRTRLV